MRVYLYRPSKFNGKAHIQDRNYTGVRPLCRSTSPSTKLTITEIFPDGRKLCSVCQQLAGHPKDGKERKKKKKGRKQKPVEGDFYTSWEWTNVRYRVLKKYGAVCMCCGSTKKIHVDHIKPRSLYPHLELAFNNLQVLCMLCNKGKSNRDETDWRPNSREEPLPEGASPHMESITGKPH